MARGSTGGSSPFAWTYLLLVFVALLAFLQTARAQDEQAPIKEDLGTGMPTEYPPDLICGTSTVNDIGPVIGIDLGTTYS